VIGRALLIGGARSGKSTAAERRLAHLTDVRYIATSFDDGQDSEWAARVALHRDRRPASWTTIETTDLVGQIRTARPNRPLLVDCLTTWLARRLDELGTWSGPRLTPGVDLERTQRQGSPIAIEVVRQEIDDLTEALVDCPGGVVLVSNEVGSGVVPATVSGRMFRDLMGICNCAVANVCDEVTLVVAGCEVPVKSAKDGK
jgi:adenosylcobinamide kinase/adenosylcobinamide-phosphate guanylyltransferase